MFEALIVTLREGVEAALVVGITLAYLEKVGRTELKWAVYQGLGAALAASLLGAGLFKLLGLDPENELLEGCILLVASLFVGSMVVWMWRTGRRLKGEMEEHLERILRKQGSEQTGRLPHLQAWGVGIFTFLMVFREGIETLLFISALTLAIGSNPLLILTGSLGGIFLAFLFGLFLVKGSLRINLKSFFTATSLILLILVFKLMANSFHEFAEVGLIPVSRTVMHGIGLIVRESTSFLILIAMILIPLILVVLDAWQRAPALTEGLSGPERRKRIAVIRQERLWKGAVGVSSFLLVMAFSALVIASMRSGHDPKAEEVKASGEEITIPLRDFAQETFRKYFWQAEDGTEVRFFVLKTGEGNYKVALDACSICPSLGYFLRSEELVCKACSAPIAVPTVGDQGGCNPVPFPYSLGKGHIVIKTKALRKRPLAFH